MVLPDRRPERGRHRLDVGLAGDDPCARVADGAVRRETDLLGHGSLAARGTDRRAGAGGRARRVGLIVLTRRRRPPSTADAGHPGPDRRRPPWTDSSPLPPEGTCGLGASWWTPSPPRRARARAGAGPGMRRASTGRAPAARGGSTPPTVPARPGRPRTRRTPCIASPDTRPGRRCARSAGRTPPCRDASTT